MTTVTGIGIKNVAGDIAATGTVTISTDPRTSATGAYIDGRSKKSSIVAGTMTTPLTIEPGPVKISVSVGSSYDQYDAIVPDSGTVDLGALKEQTYTFTESAVSAAVVAKDAAAASATAAATSAGTATTQATNASTSATAASGSATSASTSATTATTKASEASTSATNAATSASAASTSAAGASTSAGTATTQATNASTSATAAATSATAASTARTGAEAARDEAQDILDDVGVGAVPDGPLADRINDTGSAARAALDNTYAPAKLFSYTYMPTGTSADFTNLQAVIDNWATSGLRGVIRIGAGTMTLTGSGAVGALRIPANKPPLIIEGAGEAATKFVLSRSVPRLFDLYGTGAGKVFEAVTVRNFAVDGGNVTPTSIGTTTVTANVTLLPDEYTTVQVASNASFVGAGTRWASARSGGAGTIAASRMLFQLPGSGTTTLLLWNTTGSSKTLVSGDVIDGYLYDHVIFGNNNVGSTSGTAPEFENILVENITAENIPTQFVNGLGTFSSSIRFGVQLTTGVGGRAEGVKVRNVGINGGECGFSIVGSETSWIDDVVMEDCSHDTGLLPTMNSPSYNYLVGQNAAVGKVRIARCKGLNSGDVGIEIDQTINWDVSDCDIRESYSANYYVTNFIPPAKSASGPLGTTLTADLTSGATTATVATLPVGLPSSGVVRIGTEMVYYQRASATSLTLTRGIDGSTAAAATSGAAVTLIDNAAQTGTYTRCTATNLLTPGKGWWYNPNSYLPLPGIKLRDCHTTHTVTDVSLSMAVAAFGNVPYADIDTFTVDVKLNNTVAQSGANFSPIRFWRSGTVPVGTTAHPCTIKTRRTRIMIDGEVVSGPQLRPIWIGDGFYDLDIEADISNRSRGWANGATHGISIQPSGATMQLIKAEIALKYSSLSTSDIVPHVLYALGTITVTDRIYLTLDLSDAYVTSSQIPWDLPTATQPKLVVRRVLPPKLDQGLNSVRPAHIATVTTTPYAAAHVDDVILVNRSAATTINLPVTNSGHALAIPRPGAGTVMTIKDVAGNAATYNITMNAASTETIDGSATKVINTNYGVVRLVSTGTGWAVL